MSAVKTSRLRIFDQSYENKKADLQLLIQAGQSQMDLAFFDPDARQMVGIESWDLEAHNNWHQFSEEIGAILSSPELKHDFQAVSFALVEPLYTLVPTSLYDGSRKNHYLSLNHAEEKFSDKQLKAEEVSSLDTHIIFAFPEILSNFLNGRFSNLQLHHYTTPLLEAFAINKKGKQELHLHIMDDHFDIIYYADHKLQLLNSFPYQTVEDFAYYLLFVMEQLNIDRDQMELKLYGAFEEKSGLHNLLLQYVRHPHLQERSKAINYSKPLDQLPRHQFVNLFNQYLCV